MPLRFRNLDVSPSDPVERWGVEGILTAIDRGKLSDWRRVMRAVRDDPWGPVAQDLEEALGLAEDRGAVGAIGAALKQVRDERAGREREYAAAELRAIRERTGLPQGEFARRLGTSRTRVNTYLTGKVTPSAAFMVRARDLDLRRSVSRVGDGG